MSTVIEIAAAFEKLSAREREEFAEWYEARLGQRPKAAAEGQRPKGSGFNV
ncbi:MAG: hypothetical protein HZA93_01645 [Verrucomicrobia bacterium]|nr:hypothetical protein [Verrucomicrobiota bacterium]